MLKEKKFSFADISRKVDFVLILATILLTAYGALMIYSATYARGADPFATLKRQILWIILGVGVMVVVIYFDYTYLRQYSYLLYGINIFFLVAVAVMGRITHGAQRWLPILGFHFQPSEFAKLILIVTLASFLATRKGDISSWSDLGLAFAHFTVPLLLIATQPDLGTALVLAAILMGMLLAGGTRVRYYVAIILIGLIICFLLVHFNLLDPYQMKRLTVFFNPSVDPKGAGYNLAQSKIAVGSGGLLGKGLFSGTQTNLRFLPHSETDFIFSVIGEELGFLGAAILLLLYFILIMRAIVIASSARELFSALVAIGIVSMWIFQVLVNVGMAIGIMPITGIPLPFISYGGSSIITNLAAVGLLLNIYARRFSST